jgi:hypothetical protein
VIGTGSKSGKGQQGRGASKAKPAPLIRERIIRLEGGSKVVVTGRRGFDQVTLRAMLAEALAKIDDEMTSDQAA